MSANAHPHEGADEQAEPGRSGEVDDPAGRSEAVLSDRDAKGRFTSSPANRGRPTGSRHRTSLAVEQMLAGDAERITRAAIDAACSGDSAALRLCLERISPPRKPASDPVDIPELVAAKTPTEQATAILDAAGRGLVPVEIARSLLDGLAAVAKIRETDELARRIEALEAAAGAPT